MCIKTVLAAGLEVVNSKALSHNPEVSVKSQHHDEVRLRLRHQHRHEKEGCGHPFPWHTAPGFHAHLTSTQPTTSGQEHTAEL